MTFATKRNVVRRDARATLKTSAHSQNVAASSRASGTKAGSLGNIVPSPRPLQLKVNTPLQRLSWTPEKAPKSASRLLSHRQATASPQARPRSASVAMLRGAAAQWIKSDTWCPLRGSAQGGLRHSPRPPIPLISVVPLAERTVEAYPRSRGVGSSPMARGNMPYIQISDDVRSLAGAGT